MLSTKMSPKGGAAWTALKRRAIRGAVELSGGFCRMLTALPVAVAATMAMAGAGEGVLQGVGVVLRPFKGHEAFLAWLGARPPRVDWLFWMAGAIAAIAALLIVAAARRVSPKTESARWGKALWRWHGEWMDATTEIEKGARGWALADAWRALRMFALLPIAWVAFGFMFALGMAVPLGVALLPALFVAWIAAMAVWPVAEKLGVARGLPDPRAPARALLRKAGGSIARAVDDLANEAPEDLARREREALLREVGQDKR
jgi:hypothetical protein